MKQFSFLLASFLLMVLVSSQTITAQDKWDGKSVASGFSAGTGSYSNPYIIRTGAQLAFFFSQLNAGITYKGTYFHLLNDIDMSQKYCATGTFSGDFDGSKHSITGIEGEFINNLSGSLHDLRIKCSGDYSYWGHPHAVDTISAEGVMYNCYVDVNCGTYSLAYLAAFAKVNYGVIDNCFATGRLHGNGEYGLGYQIAALVYQNYGTLRNCASQVRVTNYSGGDNSNVMVYSNTGTVVNCGKGTNAATTMFDFTGDTCKVEFIDLLHFTEDSSVERTKGQAIGSLPTPSYDCTFLGWFRNGLKVSSSEIVNNNWTLFAKWEQRIKKQPTWNDMSISVDDPSHARFTWYRMTDTPRFFVDWQSTNHSRDTESSRTYTFSNCKGLVLSFQYVVSSEPSDYFIAKLNETVLVKRGGEVADTYSYTFPDNETYTLTLSFSKDDSESNGDDMVSVSNINVAPISEQVYKANKLPTYLLLKNYTYYCIVSYSNTGKKIVSDYIPISSIIKFDDANVKALCVANWDTNGDGELSFEEAAAVTSLKDVFKGNQIIRSFDELQYFKGLVNNNEKSLTDYAFQDCIGLTSIMMPKDITNIGSCAFSGCSGLTCITIPENVTKVGSSAFDGCSGLTSITLPMSLTGIGSGAFRGCSGLTSITIPESVTSIDSEAFRGCSGLTSITIPESVTSIGDSAFDGCYSLKSITIPKNVTSINNFLFSGCSCLNYITIPESVTSIGDAAFKGCSSLSSITIPKSVSSISSSAFVDCSDLKYIYIYSNTIVSKKYSQQSSLKEIFGKQVVSYSLGSQVTAIGDYAFYGYSDLNSVNVSDSVTSIGNFAFNGCSSLNYITIPGSVKDIGNSAFSGCNHLKNINIRNGVKSINDYSFKDCSGLTSVTIPESMTQIGNDVFSGCNSLTCVEINSSTIVSKEYSPESSFKKLFGEQVKEYVIGERVTIIGDNTFNGCRTLSSVTLPDSLASIGSSAFKNCDNLTSINIPLSVTTIGNDAFSGCSGLNSLVIPEGVSTIGNNAFSGCCGLTSLSIPVNVTNIGSSAFSGCSNLTSIKVEESNPSYDSRNNCNAIIETASNTLIAGCNNTIIPQNVLHIAQSAFSGCSGLTTLTIPEGVLSIGSSAFYGCSGLTTLSLPEGVTSIGPSTFHGCSGLSTLSLPEGVTSIGSSAFYGCSGLTTLSLPEGVTSIGTSAFEGCHDLTTISIPKSVSVMYDNIFNGCYRLESVTIMNNDPIPVKKAWNAILNYTTIGHATLYVPVGSKVKYKAADYWKEFKEIVELKPKNIDFVDAEVKRLCVAKWDTDGDGELSYDEAAAVTSLKDVFKGNQIIRSFDELQYFNGLANNNEKSLTDYAFKDCIGLTSITMPKNITNIGSCAFYGCTGLASITIPDSVTSIDPFVFYNCSGLTSITIPEGVTSIGDYTFYGCSGLTSITLPEGVTSIGNFAFQRCGLTSITLPRGVTTIGNCAFYECSTLSSVSIPENVTNIESTAFARCSGLTSITVAASNSFYDSRKNCNAIIQTSTNTLIAGCKNTIIPSDIVSIGNSAFDRCSGLTSINIPESVTSIGDYAFSACSGLTSITIPSSVSSIGYSAFSWCSNLTSVNIDKDTPISISESTFTNRANATLYVPFGSKAAYEAADYWKEFKEIIEDTSEIIDFADSRVKQLCVAQWDTDGDGELSYNEAAAVTSIKNVFTNKPEIQTFDELENFTGLTSINLMAFSSCSNLTSIRIPENVKSIGLSAFSNCASLKSIQLPENLEKIGSSVFYSCTSLKEVVIPNKVANIGSGVFANCPALESIKVAEGNSTYDSRGNCNAIIETSSNALIVGCRNTIIPETVTQISSNAFVNCTSLESISIPHSITSIGSAAFNGCTALTSVSVDIAEPLTITSTTFSNSENAILYVPYRSKPDYASTDFWMDFKEIRGLDVDRITIGSTGYATYCSTEDLDFTEVTGMKAYIASGFRPSTGSLVLTNITEAPAGEGLYIVGETGVYEIPHMETDMMYSNFLKGVTTPTTLSPTDGEFTNFILANGSYGVGFYTLSRTNTLAAGKAYLQLPTSKVAGVKALDIVFDDEVTGVQQTTKEENRTEFYNLQGQRIGQPRKGIYIVNGKKVFIK